MTTANTSVVVPHWKTEFNKRVAAFAKSTQVEEATVLEVLSELGVDGQDEESLTMLDNEDILQTGVMINEFVEKRKLVKIARLRMGLAHLRGATDLTTAAATTNGGSCCEGSDLGEVCGAIKDMVASNRPKADWTDEELLKVYDQDATEVAEVLAKRTKARPCIVFQRDGSVNVPVSLKLVKIAKRNPTSDKYAVDGKLVRVYRAGEFIAQPIDASPFFRGVALVAGYCASSDTHWDGISHKIRVLVRLHVDRVETAALSKREMKRICKDARNLNEKDFTAEYSEAQMIYEELETQDKLPKLKIMPDEVRPQPFAGKTDSAF